MSRSVTTGIWVIAVMVLLRTPIGWTADVMVATR